MKFKESPRRLSSLIPICCHQVWMDSHGTHWYILELQDQCTDVFVLHNEFL